MSIEKIKQLREMTGAGMMDVKKALDATEGDINLAVEWLRKNGIAKAAKKSGRIAAEGSIFIASNDKRVVMVEINSETDFVAANEKFVDGSNKIANVILNSTINSNNNDEVLKLTIESETVESYIANMAATIGEKISFRRFVAYDLDDKINAGAYKHANGRIGAIVIGDGDSDILRDIAMHVAAMNPTFLSKDEISKELIEKEFEVAKEELKDALKGKPEKIQENIINGKVNKTLSENILIEQTFVKDPSKKVKDLVASFKSFSRFEVGEGIEKKEENFAEEVARQVNK